MRKFAVIFGLLLILGGIGLVFWLGIYVMLYGGIMAAVTNWGVNNSAVVWGIIRAVFFELGMIPGFIVVLVGKASIAYGCMSRMERALHDRLMTIHRSR